METKKYTQFGTFSVIVFLVVLLLVSGKLIKTGIGAKPENFILFFVILVLFIGLLFFYKLTILISDTHVSFKFGIGLFGKSYRISDIRSARPVKNSLINGIGIRILANGWLYNVSGLKAVELHFNNKDSVVRIGTDKPEEISKAINSIIGKTAIEDISRPDNEKRINPALIFVLISLIIVAVLIISGSREANVNVDNSEISIGGSYGERILFSDLLEADTLPALPEIAMRTNGYAFGKTRTGNFRLANGINVKLFVKTGFPPYILLRSKSNKPIYINFEDRDKTLDLYKTINARKSADVYKQ